MPNAFNRKYIQIFIRDRQRNLPPNPKSLNEFDDLPHPFQRTFAKSSWWTEFQQEQADLERMSAESSVEKRVKAAPQQKWLDSPRRLRRVVKTYEEHVEDVSELENLRNLRNPAQNIYL